MNLWVLLFNPQFNKFLTKVFFSFNCNFFNDADFKTVLIDNIFNFNIGRLLKDFIKPSLLSVKGRFAGYYYGWFFYCDFLIIYLTAILKFLYQQLKKILPFLEFFEILSPLYGLFKDLFSLAKMTPNDLANVKSISDVMKTAFAPIVGFAISGLGIYFFRDSLVNICQSLQRFIFNSFNFILNFITQFIMPILRLIMYVLLNIICLFYQLILVFCLADLVINPFIFSLTELYHH